MIGHFVKINDATGQYWSLARIVEQLTNRLYLVQSLTPETGEPNDLGRWVLDIKMLSAWTDDYGPRGRIFETFLALQECIGEAEPDEPAAAPEAVH
jgi:hypothetical protein